MKIIHERRTIELTSAEAKKARTFESNMYNALQKARKDYPEYTVTVAVRRNTAKNSRLTLDDMRRYISFHDDASNSVMREFEVVCNARAYGELYNKSFFEIKKWFFAKYPEVA